MRSSAVNYSNLHNYRSGWLLKAACSRRQEGVGAGRQVLAAPRTPLHSEQGCGVGGQFQGPQPSETQESTTNRAVPEADGTHPSLTSTQCFTLCWARVPEMSQLWSLPQGAQGVSIQVSPRSWDYWACPEHPGGLPIARPCRIICRWSIIPRETLDFSLGIS